MGRADIIPKKSTMGSVGDNNQPTCGTCDWYVKQLSRIINAEGQGFCFCLPPQCTTMPSPSGQVGSFSSRPTVKPKDPCCSLYLSRLDS